jgi:hypothetical protein
MDSECGGRSGFVTAEKSAGVVNTNFDGFDEGVCGMVELKLHCESHMRH